MPCQVNFNFDLSAEDMILSPLFSPFLSLEAKRIGASHLHSFADRQLRCGFVVEKPENFVVEVD
jgi:hypothetical protein